MTSSHEIEKQLKDLGFKAHGWGRTEVSELHNIILPDEKIFECVNGFYDGGFALLLATDIRVLLIDKKPLNYLTVEDLRFDMINEIDYNHRLLGANIRISAGNKTLKFTSINQLRLRKLIGHVQRCMAESKRQQVGHQLGQNQHLEQINQQLQSYLLAQYQQQQKLQEQIQEVKQGQVTAKSLQPSDPVRPSPELADYLFAQSLLAQHQAQTGQLPPGQPSAPPPSAADAASDSSQPDSDLYDEGVREVFGKRAPLTHVASALQQHPLMDLNPLSIAYSKLPMALRNRRFGRPSFHAHSQEAVSAPTEA